MRPSRLDWFAYFHQLHLNLQTFSRVQGVDFWIIVSPVIAANGTVKFYWTNFTFDASLSIHKALAHGCLRFNKGGLSFSIPILLYLPHVFSLLYLEAISGFPHWFVSFFEFWLDFAFEHIKVLKVYRVLFVYLLLYSRGRVSCLVSEAVPFFFKLVALSKLRAFACVDETHFFQDCLFVLVLA